MTRTALVLAVLGTALVVLTQCAGQDRSISEARSDCPAPTSSAYFFPPGALAWPGRKDDEFFRDSYSKFLTRMEETSLSCGPLVADVSYRFTMLRSFGSATAIRIDRTGDKMQLQAVQLSGPAGYIVGDVVRRQSKALTASDWDRIDEAQTAAKFWQAPNTIERIGADGAQWIIEGRRAQSYHVVSRWSPESGDALRGIGILLVELAGWSDVLGPL